MTFCEHAVGNEAGIWEVRLHWREVARSALSIHRGIFLFNDEKKSQSIQTCQGRRIVKIKTYTKLETTRDALGKQKLI